ncbi:hypothetical protein BCR34DRAFT_581869 [Clohesyomyces aquaticus]|uniref:Uncharacterized protein n=1 Tax=Clohesyomyces aquaticus TaxID=1231657 RepID=A0A1Y1XUP4_9PLEO|nr:hypothetical protein BCR34DRAFT_581869 [Clohesyomyces aquaticus]
MLPSLISLRRARTPSAEDLFSSAPGPTFTDDLRNLHGDDPDTIIVYNSRRYGALEFRTADVKGEEERRKFAHYLSNASILLAELVSGRCEERHREGEINGEDTWGTAGGRWWIGAEEEQQWAVGGEAVLELGAG